MRWSARLVGRKGFVQPPFWAGSSSSYGSGLLPNKENIGNNFEAYVREG